MKITPLGDVAVLIEAGADAVKVRNLSEALASRKLPGIHDIVPAYTTVAIYYDPVEWSKSGTAKPFDAISAWIEEVAKTAQQAKPVQGSERLLPVCYGGEHGPDLVEMAAAKGMTADELVRIHCSVTYEVRAIGFSPGFPYLSGLPEMLHMPRKGTPRIKVPTGSVGIGGAQTGIYTLDTPGGWHLLGRTPVRLFRPEDAEPAWLKVGDKVRFEPITPDKFKNGST